MKKLVFYRCNHCGNVIIKLVDSMVPVFCCGEAMEVLNPNTNDGAVEKHIPVVNKQGNLVNIKVGEVLHPMTDAHYIKFVVLKTNNNLYIKHFESTDTPECNFNILDGEEIENVYAYCNLHSLWAIK